MYQVGTDFVKFMFDRANLGYDRLVQVNSG
jgi:hypothetical protein